MMKFLGLMCLAATMSTTVYAKVLVTKGIYKGQNLYLDNKGGNCVDAYNINGTKFKVASGDLTASQLSIHLNSMKLKKGQELSILAHYADHCQPTVLNPEAIDPRAITEHSTEEMVVHAIYKNKNMYIENFSRVSGQLFCAYEVLVNGSITTDEVNSSAFEMDLSEYKLKLGEKFKVVIKHREGCRPRVINPADFIEDQYLVPTQIYKSAIKLKRHASCGDKRFINGVFVKDTNFDEEEYF